jgi:probable F420-dependent oxidoreductase
VTRLVLKLPTGRVDRVDEFLTAPALADLARVAEDLGYHGVSVTDHPFPGVSWVRAGGHHTLDPVVALSIVAAATSTLTLQFALLVLPYRQPYLIAQAVASLHAASGGRVVMGVGTGYAAGEFAALGADFTARNATSDEALTAIRAAWGHAPVMVTGGDPEGHVMLPRTSRPPQVVVGGNSETAMRRAVRFGDGWMPMHNPPSLAARRRSAAIDSPDDLAAGVTRLQVLAAEAGRPRLDVYWSSTKGSLAGMLPDAGRVRAELAALSAAGADVVSVDIPGDTRRDWLAVAERLAVAALSVT